jgi:hypothetical protein
MVWFARPGQCACCQIMQCPSCCNNFKLNNHCSPGHEPQKVYPTLPYWQSVKSIQIAHDCSQIPTNKPKYSLPIPTPHPFMVVSYKNVETDASKQIGRDTSDDRVTIPASVVCCRKVGAFGLIQFRIRSEFVCNCVIMITRFLFSCMLCTGSETEAETEIRK